MNDSKNQRAPGVPELAKRMEASRFAIGLTYQTLADRAGITSAGNTQAYCKGTKRLPAKHLPGIARALGWPTSGAGWQQLVDLHALWVGEKMPRTRPLADKVRELDRRLLKHARAAEGLLALLEQHRADLPKDFVHAVTALLQNFDLRD